MHAAVIRVDKRMVCRQGARKGNLGVGCSEVKQAVPEPITGTIGCFLSRGRGCGPHEPAPELHGVQCRQADKVPDMRVDVRPWGVQEPELWACDRMLQGRAKLSANRHSHLTIPEGVQAGIRSWCSTATGTAPGGDAAAWEAVDGGLPEGLLDGVVTGESPGAGQVSREGGNGVRWRWSRRRAG